MSPGRSKTASVVYPAAVIWFWYTVLLVPLLAGVGLAVYRATFTPRTDSDTPDTPSASWIARGFAWFGVGDIEEDIAVMVTLCVGGVVGLGLHAIAHAALRTYPGWFGVVALATGLGVGVGAASVLSRNARGEW